MIYRIRGTGYGVRPVTYEKWDADTKQWAPILASKIKQLLNAGHVMRMNPVGVMRDERKALQVSK